MFLIVRMVLTDINFKPATILNVNKTTIWKSIQDVTKKVMELFRTNVASVGSVFNDTRKVKVLSLPETMKEKSTFRAKALRRELATNSRRRAFAQNVDFSFIVSGSERTLPFAYQWNFLIACMLKCVKIHNFDRQFSFDSYLLKFYSNFIETDIFKS